MQHRHQNHPTSSKNTHENGPRCQSPPSSALACFAPSPILLVRWMGPLIGTVGVRGSRWEWALWQRMPSDAKFAVRQAMENGVGAVPHYRALGRAGAKQPAIMVSPRGLLSTAESPDPACIAVDWCTGLCVSPRSPNACGAAMCQISCMAAQTCLGS